MNNEIKGWPVIDTSAEGIRKWHMELLSDLLDGGGTCPEEISILEGMVETLQKNLSLATGDMIRGGP